MGSGVWELQLQLRWRMKIKTLDRVTERFENQEQTHNLWIRDTMVLNAAWMSALVQVHTTGRWWLRSKSDTY